MTDQIRQKHILVVEDSLDLSNVVRSLLEFEGHAVELVHTGDDGLSRVLSQPYDLVILDWDLPGVSGIDILSAFRDAGARTPVIMLTGKDSIENKETGLDSGADDYLTKPFSMKELGARVRAHLRRSSAGSPASAELRLFDITLDSVNHRASRAGRNHALTPPEFQLLEFAARYPHIRPTLTQLESSAWPDTHNGDLQKLQNVIRRLRKKFDPTGKIIYPHISLTTEEDDRSDNERPATAGSEENSDDIQGSPYNEFVGLILNDKYELTGLIGGGGSGFVYRGRHVVLQLDVAIKMLHLGYFDSSGQNEMARRFQREAVVAGLLDHANVIAIRDMGLSEQNQPYIVMELVEGATLAEILHQGEKPSISEILDVFIQTCAGLEHAHRKGLIHRDIKPSNIMLTNSENGGVLIKIVDFGLARAVVADLGHAKITQTGHVLGSPPYMSPEQCRGESVDARSDIYSVGCALFEALTGRPPFWGTDPVSILINHVTASPPPLSLKGASPLVQKSLNRIIERCLAKDPQDRYQSAADLGAALNDCNNQI